LTPPPADPARAIRDVLLLRMASLMAFPAGAVLMAILERGWLSVAALAAAMLGVSLIERRRVWQALGVEVKTGPQAMLTGLAVRTGLLTGLFVVTLGVLALFRDTALSRQLGWPDLAVIAVSTAIALGTNALSAAMVKVEQRNARGADPDSIVIEGEIIDRDPR
jgi:hypothetical protein